MATFTVTTTQNIDELTSKAGGDTYNINGGTLNVDQDSRVGTNATTSTSLGSVTLSATLGGTCNIDGTLVRLIPYNTGSGNVPAWNTSITQGSASGKLIGVYSALTAASTATGAAMPASGYIKIKQWNSVAYSSGALGNIGANATGADTVGWIEIVGDEAATINANRLGTFNVTGAWYSLGTTSGSSNQTVQIPNNGLLRYVAGVFIEQTAGQADYEFYPNIGPTTTTGTEATRGKVVWIDNTGLCRIGNSGAATNGFTPASGLAIVVGNVFLENCTTAARTANVIPNSTIATRYDFTSTGGGVVNMNKCNVAWYCSFSQPYSVALTNMGTIDTILIAECATAITWSKVGVGKKPTTELVANALSMSLMFAGGTLTDCVFAKQTHATTVPVVTIADIAGFTFTRVRTQTGVIQGVASTVSWSVTRAVNCTWATPTIINGIFNLITCTNISITNTIYCNAVSGTTVTTYVIYVWQVQTNCLNVTISGLTLPVTNTHPYTALFSVLAAGCTNIKLRTIGTYAAPLTLGSANACGLIYVLAAGAAVSDLKIQRVYTANSRTNTMTADNSSTRVTEESVFGDYADAPLSAVLNLYRKGGGSTNAVTAQTAIYGTHWQDFHVSSTVGRIQIMMNESSPLTTSQISLTGGAAFTSTGGLFMPTVAQTATFEMPYYAIGHTGFANSAAVMGGATVGNYRFEYSIDKNDGGGFSAMTSSSYTAAGLGTALNGLSSISAVNGFKLKIKITTNATETVSITSLYIITSSTTTTQAYQYPLDTVTVSLTAKDISTLAGVQDARVLIEADTGGSLPAGASVTITRSGSTATVTHTSHGMINGTIMIIRGAEQGEYNGICTISNVTSNTYDYTVSGTPASPATGTITATTAILSGTTDVNGLISTNTFTYTSPQPVTGKVRRATTGTKYKTGVVVGTITSAGFDTTVLLIDDN